MNDQEKLQKIKEILNNIYTDESDYPIDPRNDEDWCTADSGNFDDCFEHGLKVGERLLAKEIKEILEEK